MTMTSVSSRISSLSPLLSHVLLLGILLLCKRLASCSAWIPPLLSNSPAAARGRRVSSLVFLSATSDDDNYSSSDHERYNSVELLQLDSITRVFCLSDLHTDHPDNQKWLQQHMAHLSKYEFRKETDLIIVAGDISHDMVTFTKSMTALTSQAQVLFVPGNHEAWIDRRHAPDSTSFDKLQQVYDKCAELGVHTQALLVGATSRHPLWIVPLESWYDGTLSFREELCNDFQYWPWADFKRCVWKGFPTVAELEAEAGSSTTMQQQRNPGQLPVGLVQHFLAKNEPLLQNNPFPNLLPNDGREPESTGILTVSHFLPNLQTLPDWKDLQSETDFDDDWFDHGAGGMSAKFAKVAGSALLDAQIRRLLPMSDDDNSATQTQQQKRNLHIFGHSHRPKDFFYKGIRYIHNPLGKPRERQLYMVSPHVDFQLVWDTQTTGEVAGPQVIRYWEEEGGGVEALQRRLQKVRPRGRYNRFKGSGFATGATTDADAGNTTTTATVKNTTTTTTSAATTATEEPPTES